jgi:hypothetical protein
MALCRLAHHFRRAARPLTSIITGDFRSRCCCLCSENPQFMHPQMKRCEAVLERSQRSLSVCVCVLERPLCAVLALLLPAAVFQSSSCSAFVSNWFVRCFSEFVSLFIVFRCSPCFCVVWFDLCRSNLELAASFPSLIIFSPCNICVYVVRINLEPAAQDALQLTLTLLHAIRVLQLEQEEMVRHSLTPPRTTDHIHCKQPQPQPPFVCTATATTSAMHHLPPHTLPQPQPQQPFFCTATTATLCLHLLKRGAGCARYRSRLGEATADQCAWKLTPTRTSKPTRLTCPSTAWAWRSCCTSVRCCVRCGLCSSVLTWILSYTIRHAADYSLAVHCSSFIHSLLTCPCIFSRDRLLYRHCSLTHLPLL